MGKVPQKNEQHHTLTRNALGMIMSIFIKHPCWFREAEPIFDMSPASLYVSGLDGSLFGANQALAEMLGYTNVDELRLELNGENGLSRLYVEPQERESWVRQQEFMKMSERQYQLQRKDGTTIWVSDKSLQMSTDLQNPIYVGSLEDITALREAALTDPLTGALNKRGLDQELERKVNSAKRYGHIFSVLYVDFDNFKRVNDEYSHKAGNTILKTVVDIMGAKIRNIPGLDVIARIGGDEFVVLLSETNANAALILAERLRKAVEETDTMYEDKHIRVTVSIGVAQYDNVSDASIVLDQADTAVHASKADEEECDGKNKCTLYVEGMGKKLP